MVLVALVSLGVAAQDNGGESKKSSVSIDVPAGLTSRSNKNAGSKQATPEAGGANAKAQGTKSQNGQAGETTKHKVAERPQHTTQQKKAGHKVGFRIQVLSDNSANGKANAQARARAIAMKFPNYRAYISYNAPSWHLRVGDFVDKEEANVALSRIRAAFPSFGGVAIVKDNINMWSK